MGDDQRPRQATVVCEIRGTREPLQQATMYEPRDLKHDALTD